MLNILKVGCIMVIDSHMYINSTILDNTQEYIDDINSNFSIESVINIRMNIETSKESISISKTNRKFYATIGIYPLYIENENINELYKLSDNDKVVAIGEIGLDTMHNNFDYQRKYLI